MSHVSLHPVILLEDIFQTALVSDVVPVRYWDRFESRVAQNLTQLLAAPAMAAGTHLTFLASLWLVRELRGQLLALMAQGHELGLIIMPAASERLDTVGAACTAVCQHAEAEHILGRRVHSVYLPASVIAEQSPATRQGCAFATLITDLPVLADDWPGCQRHLTWASWPDNEAAPGPVGQLGQRELDLVLLAQSAVLPIGLWEFDAEQVRISALDRRRSAWLYTDCDMARRNWQNLLAGTSPVPLTAVAELPQASIERSSPLAAVDRDPLGVDDCTALTIVVPCYNEEESIPFLRRTLDQFAQRHRASLQLSYVLVDDGSRDSTWRLLQQTFADLPDTRLIQHDGNQGIAAAIITGIKQVHTELLAVIDADCTFDPHQIPAMLDLLAADVDVVTASPLHSAGAMHNVPAWRQAMSYGAAFLYRRVLHQKLSSYTSCFRIYRLAKVRDVRVRDAGFGGVTELLARLDLAGCRVVEYPAELGTRLLGQSKIRTLHTIAGHLLLLTRLIAARWLGIPIGGEFEPRERHG